MVARTPLKEKRMAVALNPNLVRETVKKVDKCMARLQDLHYTITGGAKIVSGIRLSPNSTRGYLRTSLRCKQESLRLRNSAVKKSPPGKFPVNPNGAAEWRRMSLPAMLLGETVVEILKANQITKEIADAASNLPNSNTTTRSDPKTPDTIQRQRPVKRAPPQLGENTEFRARRAREKQQSSMHKKLDSSPPVLTRARSRIVFKSNSPLSRRENNTRPVVHSQRVSPKNRPWAKKTVLFPNPLFLNASSSSPTKASSRVNKFYKTRSPVIGRTTQQTSTSTTPHKFQIKSPSTSLKSQMKTYKAVPAPILLSPGNRKMTTTVASRVRRCSFSPSKLANRLVSPLRSRISLRRSSSAGMGGLKKERNNL